ncbi:hypothetical protein LRD69_21245 [Streptomyces sp. JH14]|uniref:hypothetical protein n=1 Tax=Streptomyces sp. JH14 TaxID=2793630 RepID=UPI0023F86999|nr:hypothetical protein [Streptomyces sp. JH14]MDF6044624.1 hypothetical protein [Streptomyces sp. JH14]
MATRADGPSSTAAVEDSAGGWLLPGGNWTASIDLRHHQSAYREPWPAPGIEAE